MAFRQRIQARPGVGDAGLCWGALGHQHPIYQERRRLPNIPRHQSEGRGDDAEGPAGARPPRRLHRALGRGRHPGGGHVDGREGSEAAPPGPHGGGVGGLPRRQQRLLPAGRAHQPLRPRAQHPRHHARLRAAAREVPFPPDVPREPPAVQGAALHGLDDDQPRLLGPSDHLGRAPQAQLRVLLWQLVQGWCARGDDGAACQHPGRRPLVQYPSHRRRLLHPGLRTIHFCEPATGREDPPRVFQ
mmetsp:Transcript_63714/g.201497  ORF Transcript_63714/g.201497 Transcript_63714/m.201497 type:complete len:244 (-) Transcript_63714:74-805(-)